MATFIDENTLLGQGKKFPVPGAAAVGPLDATGISAKPLERTFEGQLTGWENSLGRVERIAGSIERIISNAIRLREMAAGVAGQNVVNAQGPQVISTQPLPRAELPNPAPGPAPAAPKTEKIIEKRVVDVPRIPANVFYAMLKEIAADVEKQLGPKATVKEMREALDKYEPMLKGAVALKLEEVYRELEKGG